MATRFWVPVAVVGTGTWDASDTTHWSATSGGAGGASVPGPSDTVTFDALSCPLGETVTVNTNFSVTSLTMGAFTGTLDFFANNNSPTMQTFSGSGTGTRTLNMGSGTWIITGNNVTIWTTSTDTNLTFNANTSTVNCTYSGGTGTRTITTTANTTLNNLTISAGTDIVVIANSIKNLSFVGFTGSYSTNSVNILGNLTLGTGMTVTGSANNINMTATSGTSTITSNGVILDRGLVINTTAGVTVQLADALNMNNGTARTLTLTQGTFNANNFLVNCGSFSSSNSNVRVLTMGSGTWTLTAGSATVWTTSTVTNLTITSTGSINCTYSGSTGTRTFVSTYANFPANINVTAGSDTFTLSSSGGSFLGNINFTGFTGTLSGGSGSGLSFNGTALTLGSGMTIAEVDNTHDWTFSATSGTQTLTSNGVSIAHNVIKATVATTLVLADAIILGTTHTLTVNAGTFNANNFNVTTGLFLSSNSTTRTLTMGSGTWILTGTGTVWNTATTTNLIFNAGNSAIYITDNSSSNKAVSGGGLTFNDIFFYGAGGGLLSVNAGIKARVVSGWPLRRTMYRNYDRKNVFRTAVSYP